MSGGYWEYKDCDLAHQIFNWDIDINFRDNLKARKQDPVNYHASKGTWLVTKTGR